MKANKRDIISQDGKAGMKKFRNFIQNLLEMSYILRNIPWILRKNACKGSPKFREEDTYKNFAKSLNFFRC